MSELLLTDEEILASWGSHPKTGTVGIYHAIAQTQLNKVLQEQSKALQDYTDGKISFEKLAERMGLNFYELQIAFDKDDRPSLKLDGQRAIVPE